MPGHQNAFQASMGSPPKSGSASSTLAPSSAKALAAAAARRATSGSTRLAMPPSLGE